MQLVALVHDAAWAGADTSHVARTGHFEFRSERPVLDGAAYRRDGRPGDPSGVSLSVIGLDGPVA